MGAGGEKGEDGGGERLLRITIVINIDFILVIRCGLRGCSNRFERKRMDQGEFSDEEVIIELEPGLC